MFQDQFIDDDEEETCPLCVEEFDLTDKGFRPCPCGYQICQFCYHNVKTNMNGLCPACRRPYREEDVHFQVITPEETAAHKARQAQKQKKTQQALQKEKQKAEADNLSRKHLAGMRVVQKNLVYVTGLSPTSQEDQLLQTLRGDQYFGQYGKIIKIVVSKAKDPTHPHSVGVYVTYERKEDAASCIAAVDGSKNGDRTLRAQFGTTKYCSAYLRGENCTNRNCMFLHEPGEANESYSRADLSALNAGSSQQGVTGRPPPPQSQQPVASAAPPMVRQASSEQAPPSSPVPDRPALPSTASWASKLPQSSHRAESRSISTTAESPAPVHAAPAAFRHPEQAFAPEPSEPEDDDPSIAAPEATIHRPRKYQLAPLTSLLRKLRLEDFKLAFSPACLPQADQDFIKSYPPLFDQNGGARRRQRRQREEEQQRMEQEAQAFQQPPAIEQEESPPEMSGSLQLGGEPEERPGASQVQGAIHPPGQEASGNTLEGRFQFAESVASPGVLDRGLTPQQHQQLLLQSLKPNTSTSFIGGNPQAGGFSSSAFQQQQPQPQQPQTSVPPGHQRNVSRYSFANDTASASTAVKPVANAKLMNQQSTMMPPTGGNHFGAQSQSHGQFYTSNVQGPPPGLKTTGTPPVSGNLTFGQGHGFATGGLQYGAGASRTQQDTFYRDLLRGGDGGAGRGDPKRGGMVDVSDPGNSHLLQSRLHQGAGGFGGGTFGAQAMGSADDHDHFPPLRFLTRQHSITSQLSHDQSRQSTPPIPPRFENHLANESRRSIPSVPPGLSRPTPLPDLDGLGSRPISRSSSRASIKRSSSQILPALPLRPATPAQTPNSSRSELRDAADTSDAKEAPTKATDTHARPSRTITASDSDVGTSVAKPVTTNTTSNPTQPPAALTPVQKRNAVVKSEQAVADHETPESRLASRTSNGNTDVGTIASLETDSRKMGSQKRKHPPKLDITAAIKDNDPIYAGTPVPAIDETKSSRTSTSTMSTAIHAKVSESPVASSAAKAPMRTLRVVQTPKTESPSTTGPISGSSVAAALVQKTLSRQASVSSIYPPGTPLSEHIFMSDTISITSASQSRANSPPPTGGKVGTAPVRAKTKSQQKKERQERARALDEEKAKVDETSKAPEEPVVEALHSRKKKTKKEKEPKAVKTKPTTTNGSATAATTPTASRPPSPRPSVDDATMTETHAGPIGPSSPTPDHSPAPPRPAPQTSNEPSPPATPTLTTAQLVADLKASAPELQKCIDSLFRVSHSHHMKANSNVSHKDLLDHWSPEFKLELSKDDVDALLSGKLPAFHYGSGQDNRTFDRGMVTPTGAHLRAFTKELEARFLELEKKLHATPQESRFRTAKPQNEIRFPSIDLETLKRQFESAGGRGVSVMERMVQDGSTIKKGAFLVDESTRYINEFVMPPSTPSAPAAAAAATAATTAANTGNPQVASGVQFVPPMEQAVPTIEIAERQVNEAKRQADERGNALKRMIKKNKKLLGLN